MRTSQPMRLWDGPAKAPKGEKPIPLWGLVLFPALFFGLQTLGIWQQLNR